MRVQAVGEFGGDKHAANRVSCRLALDGSVRLLSGSLWAGPSALPGKTETDRVAPEEVAEGGVQQLAEHHQHEKLEKIIQNG